MEKDIIFQVPATITKLETKSHGSWRLQIDTQENIVAEDIAKLSALKSNAGESRVGWFTFVMRENNEKIKPDDLLDLPELTEYEDSKVTSSERLRNILWVRFTKSGGKKENFETWRLKYMDRLCESEKEKIPQD